ncbi:MAG: ABC transporter ATP-binding protein/permease [Bacilli bacterium]|nr:ABC transporter ATP-binding protein/permease [Bacilli bacterium]
MIKLFKRYLTKYRGFVILGTILKALEVAWELLVPFIIRYMIDDVVENPAFVGDKISELLKCGGVLLALAVAGLLTTLCAQYIAARVAQAFGCDMRDDLYRHINTLSFKELDQVSTASLITRIQTDTVNMQNGVGMIIRMLMRAPIIIIGATIMCFIINWKIGFLIMGFTILLLILIYGVMIYLVPLTHRTQVELDNVTRISKENLGGNRVVRAFNKQKYEFIRFVDGQKKLTNIQTKVAIIESLLNPLTFLLANAIALLVMYVSGTFFLVGGITKGDIQAFLSYFTQIQLAVMASTILATLFAKAYASSSRVNEVLALKSSLTYGTVDKVTYNDPTIISFQNVSFKYNDKANAALENVSFTIKQGETVGIIGGTGSGKTTLINLLNRFYDVSSGSIFFASRDVRDYAPGVLNAELATVMQKAVLFNGSIKENMRRGKSGANEEEISQALKIAQASDFVAKTGKGLDYKIYQSAKNLSGGQKQRLNIARALVKNAPVLILDDSSSALDYKTEANLRHELRKLDKTTLIISQRAISIMDADKILVLDKGKLIDVGTHAELYARCALYHEICASQDIEGAKHV